MIVTRARFSDFLVVGDESGVLLNSRFIHLGQIATAVVQAAEVPVSITHLADVLEQRFGRPASLDLDAAVLGVVKELVAEGVLTEVVDGE